MAIGGVIGAGFFLGSGLAISKAGPALLIAYVLAGTVVFLMMRALGELSLAYPSAGSFSTYATKFIGPITGFVTGWSFWLTALIVGVAESTGIGLLWHQWHPGTPQWIPALFAVLLLYGINMRTVESFGEVEFWLSLIKVFTIVGVLIYGTAILLFKIGDLGRHAAVSNLWTYGGLLPKGISGLVASLPAVMFAFGGIEVLGLAAAETENPQKTLPRAINGVFYRILFFYIGSLALMMVLFPWNGIDPQQSPFVLILINAGLPAAANVVTFVAITALFSSCNNALYGTSRMASALAASGQAPLRLQKLSKRNIPAFSVTLSASILMIGVLLNYLAPDRIFSYALTAIAWLMLGYWGGIALCHLNYVRGKSRNKLGRGAFQLPGSPYTNWFILVMISVVAVSFVINGSTRHVLYILVVWIGLLVAGYYGLVREEQFARNFAKWLCLLFFLD
jgi:AAT family amino acid transporter/D-serine/D-alanine/glycine transporter